MQHSPMSEKYPESRLAIQYCAGHDRMVRKIVDIRRLPVYRIIDFLRYGNATEYRAYLGERTSRVDTSVSCRIPWKECAHR